MSHSYKLFVDDMREIPPGWIGARTVSEAIAVLACLPISHVSLDHDIIYPRSGVGLYQALAMENYRGVAYYIAAMPLEEPATSPHPYGERGRGENNVRYPQNSLSVVVSVLHAGKLQGVIHGPLAENHRDASLPLFAHGLGAVHHSYLEEIAMDEKFEIKDSGERHEFREWHGARHRR
jgi:hypothetical protein